MLSARLSLGLAACLTLSGGLLAAEKGGVASGGKSLGATRGAACSDTEACACEAACECEEGPFAKRVSAFQKLVSKAAARRKMGLEYQIVEVSSLSVGAWQVGSATAPNIPAPPVEEVSVKVVSAPYGVVFTSYNTVPVQTVTHSPEESVQGAAVPSADEDAPTSTLAQAGSIVSAAAQLEECSAESPAWFTALFQQVFADESGTSGVEPPALTEQPAGHAVVVHLQAATPEETGTEQYRKSPDVLFSRPQGVAPFSQKSFLAEAFAHYELEDEADCQDQAGAACQSGCTGSAKLTVTACPKCGVAQSRPGHPATPWFALPGGMQFLATPAGDVVFASQATPPRFLPHDVQPLPSEQGRVQHMLQAAAHLDAAGLPEAAGAVRKQLHQVQIRATEESLEKAKEQVKHLEDRLHQLKQGVPQATRESVSRPAASQTTVRISPASHQTQYSDPLPESEESSVADEARPDNRLCNREVLRWLDEGRSELEVIDMIERLGGRFDLSARTVLQLRRRNVPDAVLRAMYAANQ